MGFLLGFGAAACAGCGNPVEGNGRDVLLVTFETTRADHLEVYGYDRETSPNLSRLATRGAVFERCSAVSPRTNPSLASLMTGRYPHEHGVRNLLLPLEPEERTLAEMLRGAGYRTGAVQTHPRLVAASGFAQGFQQYRDEYADHPEAAQACAVAERWIRDRSGERRPWFLWLHLMDPHWTYDPPPGFRTRFGADDPRPGRLYAELAERTRTIGPVIFENDMPPDEVAAFVDFYDAEIAYADRALGEMLRRLREEGLLDDVLTVVTADHGESLGEHDYFFEHGDLGTEPEIHIPLILTGPQVPEGIRVPATVSNIDVAPTVLDLLGIASAGTFRGRSLVPLFTDPVRDRAAFGETGKKFHPENTFREIEGSAGKWRWIRRGRFKLVDRPSPEGSRRLLFDLETDPGESRDRGAEWPDPLRALGRELDAWQSEDSGPERDYHISPEAEKILRSLGYVN